MKGETERLLDNLEKVEIGLSKIYGFLSKKDGFTNPVRKFWEILMNEERAHAKIFRDIQERARSDDAFEINIEIDGVWLKNFIAKVNESLSDIRKSDVTEADAYHFGAVLEAQLNEAAVLKQIETSDPEINRMLNKIETETRNHRMLLINYSKGVK